MKKILDIFKGDNGEGSSKRFVAITGAMVLYVTLILNSYSHVDIAPSKELVEAVEWIVISGLGFTAIEKFSTKKKDEQG